MKVVLSYHAGMIIGMSYGLISGYFGGMVDNIMQRFVEIANSVPRLVIVSVLAIFMPKGMGLSAPASLAALAVAVCGLILGLLCVCALENITMAFTMRTLDHRGMQAMLNLLMMILAGNILPLTLFPDSWQRIITLLPHAQLLDAPIRIYTGQYALSQAHRALGIQLIWVVLLILLGRAMWLGHQRRLIIQGG